MTSISPSGSIHGIACSSCAASPPGHWPAAGRRRSSNIFGVSDFQLDIFLFEPGTDRYLGRLCGYSVCPKQNKVECMVPGCGTTAFNKVIPDFEIRPDLLATAPWSTLYRRGEGILRSATDLPQPGEEEPRGLERLDLAPGEMVAEPQLFVQDMAVAIAFYRDRLGFELAFAYGDPPFYAQIRRGAGG